MSYKIGVRKRSLCTFPRIRCGLMSLLLLVVTQVVFPVLFTVQSIFVFNIISLKCQQKTALLTHSLNVILGVIIILFYLRRVSFILR